MEKFNILLLTILLVFISSTTLYAFYPDSAHVIGFTKFWAATGCASGSRVSVRDSMDYIHAVYSYRIGGPYADSGEIYYAYSTDHGLTWSTSENVSHTDTCTSTDPSIAIDSKGRLHCVWKQLYIDTSTSYYDYDMYYSQHDGTGWTPAVNISNLSLGANGCYSSMVIDSEDHVHVVYDMSVSSGNWDIYYSFYNDTVWSSPYMVSNTPYDDAFPAMAIDCNDCLHVVWRQLTTNAPIYYSKYDGNTWSTPEVITNFTYGQSAYPCIVVDSNSYPHVIWSWGELPADSGDIFYATYNGVSWTSPINLSNTINVSCYHSLAIDSLNQLYVVWTEKTPTVYQEIFYRTFNGSVWSGTINLTQDVSLSWCPKLGNPIVGEKVDLVWVDSEAGVRSVMYMGLSFTGIYEETNLVRVENHLPYTTIFRGALHLQQDRKFEIFDITGRQIHTINPEPGIYFIEVNGEIRQKVIKVR